MGEMEEEIVVLVTTASEDEAAKIGRTVVEHHLAACANIIPRIRSIFEWEGRVSEEAESLLVLKSHRARFEELSKKIKELHSYSVPEVIAIPINQGLPAYLQWVREATGTDREKKS